jgi:hypothetical protein
MMTSMPGIEPSIATTPQTSLGALSPRRRVDHAQTRAAMTRPPNAERIERHANDGHRQHRA